MSKATEAPVNQEPAPYVMPVPQRGQAVMYYPNGVVGAQNAMVGYVLSVSRANIELNVAGMLRETVCHQSDPVVKENQFARKCGVWDFSPRDLLVDKQIAELTARVAALEAAKPSK